MSYSITIPLPNISPTRENEAAINAMLEREGLKDDNQPDNCWVMAGAGIDPESGDCILLHISADCQLRAVSNRKWLLEKAVQACASAPTMTM